MPLNKARLALSASVIGLLAYPVFTGSIKRFVEEPVVSYREMIEDRQARYLRDHHLGEFSCDIASFYTDPQNRYDQENAVCRKAATISNIYVERTYYPNLPPLVRDALVGLLFPLIIILALPPLYRMYLRWLTEGGKS